MNGKKDEWKRDHTYFSSWVPSRNQTKDMKSWDNSRRLVLKQSLERHFQCQNEDSKINMHWGALLKDMRFGIHLKHGHKRTSEKGD